MKQSIFFVCILWMAGFVACSSNDNDSAIPDTGSNINVFIAVPGGHYDVAIGSEFIASNLGEGEYTGYKTFRAQRYVVNIYAAGDRSKILTSGELNMRNNAHYSAFLSIDHNNNLRLTGKEDLLTPVPDKFAAKIRVVNLSDTYNNLGQSINLDFYLSDLIDTARFQNVTYTTVLPFSQIQAGSYNRDIHVAGTTQSLLGKIPEKYSVADGKFVSWIVYGNALKSDSFKLAEFIHN